MVNRAQPNTDKLGLNVTGMKIETVMLDEDSKFLVNRRVPAPTYVYGKTAELIGTLIEDADCARRRTVEYPITLLRDTKDLGEVDSL